MQVETRRVKMLDKGNMREAAESAPTSENAQSIYQADGFPQNSFEHSKEQAENLEKEFRKKMNSSESVKPRLVTLTHAELLKREIPPRKFVLSPWLPEAGISMVFSPTGIGKTYLGLSMARVIASGGKLFGWEASHPRKVLYVDAEMHESDLQQRIKKLGGGFEKEMPDESYLRYLNGTWLSNGQSIPDLSTKEGQLSIEDSIGNTQVLFLDNLSTLCRSGKENEVGAWMQMQSWLLSLRWRGITVVLIHHSGKAKDEGGNPIQRGSSAREIILESILVLKRPKDYSAEHGCVFEGHFLKSRGFQGVDAAPFEARLKEKKGVLFWEYRQLEARNYDLIIDLFNDGITNPREIGEEIGISRQAVQKHINKAKQDGDIR